MQTDREILLKILAAQALIVDKLHMIEERLPKDFKPGSNLYGAVREITRNEERIIQEFNAMKTDD